MNQKKIILLSAALAMASSTLAMTSGTKVAADTLPARSSWGEVLSSRTTMLSEAVFDNPSMQRYHHRTSLNTLRMGYDYAHASQPIRLEQGGGHSMGLADIDAYLHRGKATLWGRAAYQNGGVRGIRFSESSDFERLYPYLMADTVGGNNHLERYHFMGGFSCPVGRWNIAAEGQYTALMEYRTVDPRPKNLTGDLRAKVGLSYVMGSNVLGLALSAGRYKQTNEVKLYNEVAVPTIFHLTGLGADYYRFRGINTSTYYKGHTLGAMLSYLHRDGLLLGSFAHGGYNYTETQKIISSLNELPMATLRHHHQYAMAGHAFRLGRGSLGFRLSEDWQRRQGFEHIFGTAQDNIYPQIATSEAYRLTTLRVGGDVLWQPWRFGASQPIDLALQAGTHYAHYFEQYAEPYRQMKALSWTSHIGAEATAEGRRLVSRLRLKAVRTWHTRASIQNIEGTLATPTLHFYRTQANGLWQAEASAEVVYKADARYCPFVRADWSYGHYAIDQHASRLCVAVGVHF